MAAFSDYLENKAIEHIFGVATYTPSSTFEIGLFTSDAGLESNTSGSWTEVSGGSYAREPVTFTSATAGTISNNSAISFTPATASWGTISHVAVLDASNNVLSWGPVTLSRTIESGDVFLIEANELEITLQ